MDKLSLKNHEVLKHAKKSVIYPIIISEEVMTTGEVRERTKETVSKTCERKEETLKNKTIKKY
jgi:hypothetical protein